MLPPITPIFALSPCMGFAILSTLPTLPSNASPAWLLVFGSVVLAWHRQLTSVYVTEIAHQSQVREDELMEQLLVVIYHFDKL